MRDDGSDRTYIGLPSSGRSPKFALQALVAALLQSAAALLEKGSTPESAIDPYWTCVAYFNSLRELGGAWVLMQDDVPRQMQFLASRLAATCRQLEYEPEELSSRISSRDLPQVLQSLEVKLDSSAVFAEPKDTVLASNMISVGVDVPRLGLMVVNGQPKSTSEYIQASSRIGRGLPGLVFTVYNVGRPRDLSHFEHFRSYHEALYRNVEATSVTPWAPRARDKALHAVVVAVNAAKVVFAERKIGTAQLPPAKVQPLPLDKLAEERRAKSVEEKFGTVAPGVVKYTTEALFRDLWLRPDLAPRDRSVVTVSALVAAGQTAQIIYHLNRAMDNGLTEKEAGEMLAQLAFYAG